MHPIGNKIAKMMAKGEPPRDEEAKAESPQEESSEHPDTISVNVKDLCGHCAEKVRGRAAI